MRKRKVLIFMLMLIVVCMQAQTAQVSETSQTEEYRKALGLDMSIPDFETNKIDDAKMGTRLANLLRFFEETYKQGTYSFWISSILREQYEELKPIYFEISKLKLQNVSKRGDELLINYKVWIDPNPVKKQMVVSFRFIKGVSESKTVNEMFSDISRYVKTREEQKY